MNPTEPGKDFSDILLRRDPALANTYEAIKAKGMEDWVYLLMPDHGSHAGVPHLRNVERIANKIVPADLKGNFSDGEIFLLLCSIFLHDIGKTIPKDDDPGCGKEDNCPLRDEETNFRPCDKANWNHHQRGEDFINQFGIELGLPDEKIARYCGLLTYCHGLPHPPVAQREVTAGCPKDWDFRGDFRPTSLAPYGMIRVPLLASILRIADETDNLWSRALKEHWFEVYKKRKKDVGKAFRRCIEDIEFCYEGQCLIIHVVEMDAKDKDLWYEFIKSVNKVRDDIEKVIHAWGGELQKLGISFKNVYIEYENRLYTELKYDKTTDRPYPQSLRNVVGSGNPNLLTSMQQILGAMIQLSLGSYGFTRFPWEILEAQVGRPLTPLDRWLTMKLADVSENSIVINDQNELHLNLTRDNLNDELTALLP
jgi:hypothetical protein